MKKIAELAGVSSATVSHVLSGKKKVCDETRERVMKAIEQENYKLNTIAKSLRTNKTHIIGVLVEDICGLPVAEIVDGINEYLEQSNYQVLLSNLRLLQKLYNQYDHDNHYTETINKGMHWLEDARVDGIIYVAMHDRLIGGIHHPPGAPLIYAYAQSTDLGTVSITYENELSAYNITQLLTSQHHKKIAIIAGHADSPMVAQRLAGYKKALEEKGIEINPDYIRQGDWEYESGLKQTTRLLALPNPPTGIFAMNDLMAAGCYAAIARKGLRIPQDISVVGFDNREISGCLYPPLTTVALPNKQIGYTAAEQLLLCLQEGAPEEARSIILPCRTVERSSTMKI